MFALGRSFWYNEWHNWEYFLVLALSLSIPLVISLFHPILKMNKKEWRLFAISSTLPALVFLLWDSWATSRGHWQFNPLFITGLKLGNLPLEEIVFFWVIPFCCQFVWRLIQKYNNFTHLLQDFFSP